MNPSLICKGCGAANRPTQYFCSECGLNLHMPQSFAQKVVAGRQRQVEQSVEESSVPKVLPVDLPLPASVLAEVRKSDVEYWETAIPLGFVALLVTIGIVANVPELTIAECWLRFFVLEFFAFGLAAIIYSLRRDRANADYAQRIAALKQDRSEAEAKALTARVLGMAESYYQHRGTLKGLIEAVDKHISVAKREYDENVFAPFWDQIESAGRRLSDFRRNLQAMEFLASDFARALKGRTHNIPPLVLGDIPDPRPQLDAFNRLVRQGQRDFQFAMIWEQRTTRAALVEGFTTLGESILGLPPVVEESILKLRTTIDAAAEQSNEEQRLLRGHFDEAVADWRKLNRLEQPEAG